MTMGCSLSRQGMDLSVARETAGAHVAETKPTYPRCRPSRSKTVLPRLSAFNSRAILGGFAGFLRRGPVRALVSVADERLRPLSAGSRRQAVLVRTGPVGRGARIDGRRRV